MFRLLKNLFSIRDGGRTVVIVNDDGSKPSKSHRLHAVSLWMSFIGVILAVVLIVVILIRYTPLGGLVYDQGKIRDSVIEIQQKVASLQDTIEARNIVLRQMQNVIAEGRDTTFNVTETRNSRQPAVSYSNENRALKGIWNSERSVISPAQQSARTSMELPVDAVLISNLFKGSDHFPAPYPIDGTITRKFNLQSGHYGLDIAATAGDSFRAVADGVVISEGWTFNYGYVITVQHSGGVITIYKHAQRLEKSIGEAVRQGDILGTMGNVGILSSGPHLHIEIWKNGIPQNPENYLIKS